VTETMRPSEIDPRPANARQFLKDILRISGGNRNRACPGLGSCSTVLAKISGHCPLADVRGMYYWRKQRLRRNTVQFIDAKSTMNSPSPDDQLFRFPASKDVTGLRVVSAAANVVGLRCTSRIVTVQDQLYVHIRSRCRHTKLPAPIFR
jgi:hypothetical protein